MYRIQYNCTVQLIHIGIGTSNRMVRYSMILCCDKKQNSRAVKSQGTVPCCTVVIESILVTVIHRKSEYEIYVRIRYENFRGSFYGTVLFFLKARQTFCIHNYYDFFGGKSVFSTTTVIPHFTIPYNFKTKMLLHVLIVEAVQYPSLLILILNFPTSFASAVLIECTKIRITFQ